MVVRPSRPATGPGLPVENVGFLTETSHMAPMLAKKLAELMESEGADPREIARKTGWLREGDRWVYNYGDQDLQFADDPKKLGMTLNEEARVAEPAAPSLTELGMAPHVSDNWLWWTRGGPSGPYEDTPSTIEQPMAVARTIGTRTGIAPDPTKAQVRDPNQLDFEYEGSADAQDAFDTAYQLRRNRSMPEFRPPRASELFKHPMMFEGTEGLSDIPMSATFEPPGSQGSGSYQRPQDNPLRRPKGHIEVSGTEAGRDTQQTAKSVALHELGHAEAEAQGRPMGGSPQEAGAGPLGLKVMERAKALLKRYGEMRDQLGIEMRFNSQDLEDFLRKWTNTQLNKPKDPSLFRAPDYLGYQALWGEAMSRLMQKLADLPTKKMTGGSENLPGYLYRTRGGQIGPYNDNPGATVDPMIKHIPNTGPIVQGDIHPYQALDVPPELMFMRNQGSTYNSDILRQGAFRPQGEYDWLFLPEMKTIK